MSFNDTHIVLLGVRQAPYSFKTRPFTSRCFSSTLLLFESRWYLSGQTGASQLHLLTEPSASSPCSSAPARLNGRIFITLNPKGGLQQRQEHPVIGFNRRACRLYSPYIFKYFTSGSKGGWHRRLMKLLSRMKDNEHVFDVFFPLGTGYSA